MKLLQPEKALVPAVFSPLNGIPGLLRKKNDFSKNCQIVHRTSIFVAGLSGAGISIGSVQLKGMALSAVVGVVLSLMFWLLKKMNLMNSET